MNLQDKNLQVFAFLYFAYNKMSQYNTHWE